MVEQTTVWVDSKKNKRKKGESTGFKSRIKFLDQFLENESSRHRTSKRKYILYVLIKLIEFFLFKKKKKKKSLI
jgi:hypothetical protein